MTAAEIKEIQAAIEEEIAKTEHDIERLEELTARIPPDNAIGRLTRMDAINNRSVNEATLDAAIVKLNRLEKALSRIENNSFGKCVSCSAAISDQRLKLMPEADRCMKCVR